MWAAWKNILRNKHFFNKLSWRPTIQYDQFSLFPWSWKNHIKVFHEISAVGALIFWPRTMYAYVKCAENFISCNSVNMLHIFRTPIVHLKHWRSTFPWINLHFHRNLKVFSLQTFLFKGLSPNFASAIKRI